MSLDASLATVAGCRKVCATSSRGRGMGGSKTWVGVLFCHESFEAGTPVSNGNNRTRCGIWPRDGHSPPGPVSGYLGFWPRVTIAVQFGHRDGGL